MSQVAKDVRNAINSKKLLGFSAKGTVRPARELTAKIGEIQK